MILVIYKYYMLLYLERLCLLMSNIIEDIVCKLAVIFDNVYSETINTLIFICTVKHLIKG